MHKFENFVTITYDFKLIKIKTESLLLFCKDLILSYKDKVDLENYAVDKDIIENF